MITDKTKCCGCQACANICTKNCISMRADEEGFLYPQVDKSACVNCGLCEKVCPILNKPQTFPVLAAYAAKHTSPDIKLKSSSGGIFSALAEVILKEGGVVFGASFDKDWNVIHSYVEKLEDLDKLRRSKYVQSNIGKTYQQAKQFLEQSRPVLFTGTPCQIAGLRNYLGKEYEKLITADIICHAAPSPAVWQKFLHENLDVNQIKAINFREKRIGWSNFYLSFLTPHGLNAHGDTKTLLERVHFKLRAAAAAVVYRNTFLNAFLKELINRPSCHTCHFKGLNERVSDFTLGDLWGQWPGIITNQDKKYGMSALLVNTPKGKTYFEKICPALTCQAVEAQRVAHFNSALEKSTVIHPKRTEFFARYKIENFNKLVRELLGIKPAWITIPLSISKKVAHKVKNLLK